jgi:hypothetical protein
VADDMATNADVDDDMAVDIDEDMAAHMDDDITIAAYFINRSISKAGHKFGPNNFQPLAH